MAGAILSIKEYFRSHHGVVRASLADIIRKTITVQTCVDSPTYATPDDEMIVLMLHLLPDKNRLHDEQSVQSVKEHTAEYKIDNRSVYNILDQIYNDTNDKNRLHDEQSVQSVKEHTAEYKIDNRSVYNNLDQICNYTNLYPNDKSLSPRGMAEGCLMPFIPYI